jgi:NAD(P)-dependent dehydrogenase (short-subunit alcohol dehydrogenase family)
MIPQRASEPSRGIALVTGAAGAIGSAICRELIGDGYHVIACDERAGALREQCAALGDNCQELIFDLSDSRACAEAIKSVAAGHHRLDVLVNNAGTWFVEPFEASSDEHWRKVFEVNVLAPVRLSRLALSLLRKSQRPRIVMIGSKNGVRGEPMLASYNVSKAALSALVRSMASELGAHGILVNCVAPGVIDTPSNMEVLSSDELSAAYRRRIPLGRLGTAQEVASMVAFLCSERCSFATGSTFLTDGGQLAGEPA